MERVLKVTGMHCRSCEVLLKDVVEEITGVEKAEVDSRKGTVTMEYNGTTDMDAVRRAIEKEGYAVVVP